MKNDTSLVPVYESTLIENKYYPGNIILGFSVWQEITRFRNLRGESSFANTRIIYLVYVVHQKMFASAYANGASGDSYSVYDEDIRLSIHAATAACVDILTIRNIYQKENVVIILGMDCSDLMEIGLIQVFEKHEIKYCAFIRFDDALAVN
ncbi:hypothetical protein C1645_818410 [Glomus cerebriforme]|uniref:Uncharacterized protein n=1 Tax=Glomus cerebriforme TaxID=658196 RepID=A0A397T7I0_9GLOM|nr:hypothetical protein C1645_818410 [Glomus cerebriforme]